MSVALGLTPEESEVRESEENKFRKKSIGVRVQLNSEKIYILHRQVEYH